MSNVEAEGEGKGDIKAVAKADEVSLSLNDDDLRELTLVSKGGFPSLPSQPRLSFNTAVTRSVVSGQGRDQG